MNNKYTAAELAFVKRRKKMPRRELLLAFRRKFRRRDMTLLRLQDLCNRKGWGVGSLKGRTKGLSRRYYDKAPDELKPTIMAIAKLEHRLHEKSPA